MKTTIINHTTGKTTVYRHKKPGAFKRWWIWQLSKGK